VPLRYSGRIEGGGEEERCLAKAGFTVQGVAKFAYTQN
jgi:hypothetical protein